MATVSDVTSIDYSGDARVDSLLDLGPGWNYLLPTRNTLYYTFDTSASASILPEADTATFNASQRAATAAILTYVASVTGIGFAEVATGAQADLHFAATDIAGASVAGQTQTSWGYSYSLPGEVLTAYNAEAYIFLDNANWASINTTLAAGSEGYEVLLHEIGHALGLGHPFEGPYALPDAQDNTNNTVMSYTPAGGAKSVFQSYDLLTLQWIYGGDGLGGTWGLNSANGPSLTFTPPPPPPPPPPPQPTPTDDYAATTATTGSVAIDGTRSGAIEQSGDADWFAVSLQAGTRYVFTLEGSATGAGTLADPVLRLRTSGGATLASNDDAGGTANARIAYMAATSGVHYLEAASALSGGTGTYRVSASRDLTNNAPVAVDDAFATKEDQSVSGSVILNDSEPDGQPITTTVLSGPQHGSLALQTGGLFTYTPTANYHGSDGFTYRLSDGLLSSTATVSLTILPVNDPPVATGTAVISLNEDTSRSGTLPVATDGDGDPLVYAKLADPAHGTVTITAGGGYTYTPFANYAGSDSFGYRVSDGTATTSATVSVNVVAVNDAPVASGLSITTSEDTPRSGNLPAASDPDGDTVTFAKAGDPQHGTVTIAPAGQYTYTPQKDWSGSDAFTFRVTDGRGGANTYTATVTVQAVADTLTGTPAADTLVDTSGPAQMSGLAGDDRLQGGSGDDGLDGGPGTDTAVYAGAAGGYRVARTGAGWTVTDRDGGDGVDTLTGIERLDFTDRDFELVTPRLAVVPAYGAFDGFLFDPVFYTLQTADLVPTLSMAGAWAHYVTAGAASGQAPNAWFDAGWYENRWPDLTPLDLDPVTLFRHFNLFGVWEGRAPGPAFASFDGTRYLRDNPDVAAYVDANVDDFLGSRSNGAIAHYILYGASEGRSAFGTGGQPIPTGYVFDLGG